MLPESVMRCLIVVLAMFLANGAWAQACTGLALPGQSYVNCSGPEFGPWTYATVWQTQRYPTLTASADASCAYQLSINSQVCSCSYTIGPEVVNSRINNEPVSVGYPSARLLTVSKDSSGSCTHHGEQNLLASADRAWGCTPPKLQKWVGQWLYCAEVPQVCPVQSQNPVEIATRRKVFDEVDLSVGSQNRIAVTRSYQSDGFSGLPSSGLGTAWAHDWNAIVSKVSATRAVYTHTKGDPMVFDFINGAYVGNDPVSFGYRLTSTGPSGADIFQITDPNSSVWNFDVSGRLASIVRKDGQVNVTRNGTGQVLRVSNEQGHFIDFEYTAALLTRIQGSDGSFRTYSYDSSGRLLSVSDGTATKTYHYNEPLLASSTLNNNLITGVSDWGGDRYLTVSYNTTDSVSSTELAGGVNRHTFNGTTVTDPLLTTRTFNFTTAKGVRLFAGVSSPCPSCGGTFKQRTYTPDGFLTEQLDFLNTPTTFVHDTARQLEIVRIEAKGKDTRPALARSDERKVETSWHANWRVPVERKTFFCAAPTASYQPCNNATNTRWTLESLTRHAVNARGQITAVCQIDPANATAMAYTCGSATNAPTGVRQTVTDYCDTTDADFNSATCPFEGYVKTIDGPRTDVADITTRTYFGAEHPSCATQPTSCPYRKGDLRYLDNALGQRTEFIAYDGAGRLLRQKDANGVITDLVYHPRGWLLSRTVRSNADGTPNTSDAITRIEYEPYGEVKRVIQPDEVGMEYCRDAAHRIKAVVQTTLSSPSRCSSGAPTAGSEAIVYTLDAAGNRTKEEVRDSTGATKRLLARQYNTLGELRSLINAPFAANTNLDDPSVKKTTYTYDANSNQDLATDPLGRVGDNDYDPLNRLIQSIQDKDTAAATGEIQATVKYEYDARDNLRKVIDPKNLTTEYVYDGLNNQTQLISPDTGTTSYTYDAAGNRLSQTDARGVVSNYAYDVLGRLTAISYPSDTTKNVGFVYDSVESVCAPEEQSATGRLSKITDASGQTQLCYDRRGNLRRKVQTSGGQVLSVQYRYNSADRLISMTYPSGLVVDYTRDTQGRIASVNLSRNSFALTLVSGVNYLPFGPIGQISFPSQTLSKTWDQNYWPDAVQGSALDYDFSTNEVGNITQVASASEGTQNLGYDRLDRLNEVRDQNAALIEAFTYDATGNRLSHSVALPAGSTPTVTSYTYPGTSHRLTQVGSAARSFDAVGNTLSGVPGFETDTASFDARNRLTTIGTGGSAQQRANYNGRGERVLASSGAPAPALPSASGDWATGGITGTLYDESGQVISKLVSGSALRFEEIVWIDNTPVGRVLSSTTEAQEVYAIHSDHLNTPRALASAQVQNHQPAGTVVWRWKLNQHTASGSNAFGALAASEDVDGNGSVVKFDLRFPGQQWDAAVGLHYNYFRDYEAGTGRYVESDPIGLRGGINSYQYVNSEPLSAADTHGLFRVRARERWNGGAGDYEWVYWFDFSSCVLAAGEEAVGSWMKAGRVVTRATQFYNAGAGDNDITDIETWCKCLQSDPQLRAEFESAGYSAGTLAAGSSSFTESEAADMVQKLRNSHTSYVEKNCKEDCANIRNAYQWDTLLERARSRGTKHPRRYFEWMSGQ